MQKTELLDMANRNCEASKLIVSLKKTQSDQARKLKTKLAELNDCKQRELAQQQALDSMQKQFEDHQAQARRGESSLVKDLR